MFGFWAACVGTHCVRVDEAAGGPVPFGVRCRRAVGSAHFVLVQAEDERLVVVDNRMSPYSDRFGSLARSEGRIAWDFTEC